jgi:hypothetical protein
VVEVVALEVEYSRTCKTPRKGIFIVILVGFDVAKTGVARIGFVGKLRIAVELKNHH